MGKINNDNGLTGQRISRSLLAISFAASLAALGCTTNHNIGNGTPTRSGPDVRTAPTSGVTSGGETTTPVNPPMTSSYNRSEMLPVATSRTIRRRSPDEAAAIMAGRQVQGRYLGVVNPGPGGRPYESANIQTYQNPAMLTNPQITINSSITSPATPIDGISDADADALFVTAGTTTGTTTTGTTTGTTTTGTTAAATVAGTGTTLTPTTAAAGLPIGTFAGVAASPTLASANTPSVTAASAGLGRTTAARTATTGTTTTGTTATPTAATTGTTAAGVRVGTVTSPVRVTRATSGSVTVTNVGATPTTASSGRNQ